MENALKPFVRPRTKSSIGCSGITKRPCTQPWATSAPCGSNKTGIAAPQPLQTDEAKPMKAGYGKVGKQKTLSCFPTATTTTNYNYLWDTDSEGKITSRSGLGTIARSNLDSVEPTSEPLPVRQDSACCFRKECLPKGCIAGHEFRGSA